MKLIVTKDNPYLSKEQWKKLLLAASIMTLVIYTIAMIASLCGSNYFILDYQNAHMDSVEQWLRAHQIYGLVNLAFSALEFTIVFLFVVNKRINPLYALGYYLPVVILAFIHVPDIIYKIYPFIAFVLILIIYNLISYKRIDFKLLSKQFIRYIIALAVVFTLQVMIYVIKAGYFSVDNHVLTLSAMLIYTIEYDIALTILLMTIKVFTDREKGDSTWTTDTDHGSSSQISKTKSQKSSIRKNLTKTQINRLHQLYMKVYLMQSFGFLLIMVFTVSPR